MVNVDMPSKITAQDAEMIAFQPYSEGVWNHTKVGEFLNPKDSDKKFRLMYVYEMETENPNYDVLIKKAEALSIANGV